MKGEREGIKEENKNKKSGVEGENEKSGNWKK
jgi:hypothetical protein